MRVTKYLAKHGWLRCPFLPCPFMSIETEWQIGNPRLQQSSERLNSERGVGPKSYMNPNYAHREILQLAARPLLLIRVYRLHPAAPWIITTP